MQTRPAMSFQKDINHPNITKEQSKGGTASICDYHPKRAIQRRLQEIIQNAPYLRPKTRQSVWPERQKTDKGRLSHNAMDNATMADIESPPAMVAPKYSSEIKEPDQQKASVIQRTIPFDKEIDSHKLNIVGEQHNKYNDLREDTNSLGDLERQLTKKIFGNEKQHYFLEPELEEKTTKAYHNGDSSLLRLLFGLFNWLENVRGLNLIANDSNANERKKGFDRIINEIDSNKRFLDLVFLHLKLEYRTKYQPARKLFKKVAPFLEKAKEIAKNSLLEEATRVRLLSDIFKQTFDEIMPFLLGNTSHIKSRNISSIKSLITHENMNLEKTFKIMDLLCQLRSDHMFLFARKYASKKIGIWKVGDKHISEIQKSEDEFGGEGFVRNYTLIEKREFEKIMIKEGYVDI